MFLFTGQFYRYFIWEFCVIFASTMYGKWKWAEKEWYHANKENGDLFRSFNEIFTFGTWNKVYKIIMTKDVRELSWMSRGVMRFWFLLNFLLISAFFDILAALSISRVFPSGISGRWKSSCSDIPGTIIKFDYIN